MYSIKLPKPQVGEPCNGCGLCCQIQVCRNGAYVLKLVKNFGDTVPGPCPALTEREDGSFGCGIVINPLKYIKKSKYRPDVLRREFANLIGSGSGCDEVGLEYSPEEEARLDEMIRRINTPEWVDKMKKSIRIIHGIEL